MGLYGIEGEPGSGKSFVAMHHIIPPYLLDTNRHVYTNLPCDGEQLEWYLAWLTRNPAKQNEIRQRLHFLRPGPQPAWEHYWISEEIREWTETVLDEKGKPATIKRDNLAEIEQPWPEDDLQEEEYRAMGFKPVRRPVPRQPDGVREFWYFCEPGSVVVLDELADIYNSLDGLSATGEEKKGRRVLQSFINHHRHYKLDLYFFMQSREDVDMQVRRKIANIYYVENSKRVNVSDFWALRGLRWPVQFFQCRVFAGRKVLGKGADFDVFVPLRTFRVWPTRRRYRNYRSFSAGNTGIAVKGLRSAKSSAKSTDVDTVWDRVRDWVGSAGVPIGMAVGILVVVYLFWSFVSGMAHSTSADTSKWLGVKAATNSVSVAGRTNSAATTNATAGIATTNAIPKDNPETITLVSPYLVRTTRRVFLRGQIVGTVQLDQFTATGAYGHISSKPCFVGWGVLLRGPAVPGG